MLTQRGLILNDKLLRHNKQGEFLIAQCLIKYYMLIND